MRESVAKRDARRCRFHGEWFGGVFTKMWNGLRGHRLRHSTPSTRVVAASVDGTAIIICGLKSAATDFSRHTSDAGAKSFANSEMSGGLFWCVARVFPVEAFNAAGGVEQLLLASEKRVAVRADFNTQHRALHCGLGLKRVAASAVNGYFVVVGMDAVFHCYLPCGRSARQERSPTAASLGHWWRIRLRESRRRCKGP